MLFEKKLMMTTLLILIMSKCIGKGSWLVHQYIKLLFWSSFQRSMDGQISCESHSDRANQENKRTSRTDTDLKMNDEQSSFTTKQIYQ